MIRVSMLMALTIGLTACSNTNPKDWSGYSPSDSADPNDTDTDVDADTDTDTADTDTDTDSAPPDTDTDTDADTDTDSGGGDTDTAAAPGFDEPGDIVTYEDTADTGSAKIDVTLTDASGDSNRDQEFYLVLLNMSTSDVGYRLRYYNAAPGPNLPPPPAPPAAPRLPHAKPRIKEDWAQAPIPPGEVLTTDDIGTANHEFLIRNNLYDTSSFDTANTTLWALGTNVEIWVDVSVPIDWDYECDGVVDEVDPNNADGFDNCDLADVADIMDGNIIPNLRALYGDESDVNGDGRVSVVITPTLNAITLTSTSDTDFTSVLPSYAEPDVDLLPFDSTHNPGSDEEEVIYVYAPDPNGYYNINITPSVESYTGYQLAGEFARSFTKLISYNQHVIVPTTADPSGDYDAEEDWVVNGLGTLGADLCGFGAPYYDDVWKYLDAPHLSPLEAESSDGSLASLDYGAQYLFMRWVYDKAEADSPGSGAAVMTAIMQSGATTSTTGEDSIEAGTGEDIKTTALNWQIGMLTTGITDSTGAALVDPATYPPFAAATTISAPPSSPGNYYGANGYQSGFNLNGENHLFQDGITDSPSEITADLTTTSNQFAYIYSPGYEFNGFASGGYGVSIVRMTGITYDEALMEVQASQAGAIEGAVIRWNDPDSVNYAVEESYSASEAFNIDLPALPDDGGIITGEGEIGDSTTTNVVKSDGSTGTGTVYDTDRWLLDLTDRSASESVPITVWLKRHFTDTSGTLGPSDPWVAIVPEDLLPQPTTTGTVTNSTCTDAPVFAYPVSILEYLYYQQFLSTTMYSSSEFDPCGTPPEDTAGDPDCSEDWDLDGIADDSEATPTTLLEQIEVADCTVQGATNDTYVSTYDVSWMDEDEQDSDDRPAKDLANNTGGRSSDTGEEGYVHAEVPGGARYVLVVGGNSGTGIYEINVRQTQH